MTTLEQAYVAELTRMAENAKAWRAANPGREVKIQFNYPPRMALVAPISQAIKNLYVVTNDAGLELIKALWPWDTDREPTVIMVRAVLEYEK